MKKSSLQLLTEIFVLLLITVLCFSFSVDMRSEYFGKTSEEHHHHLTGSTVIFVNNWLEHGAVNVGFTMLENPSSVEFETFDDRVIYDSYPPGCILSVYIAARLTMRSSVDFAFVETVNLANQLMITALLVGTVYIIVRRKLKLNYVAAMLFSLVPVSLQLFMPAPFYFFQNVYFADHAVLLPFAATIFLELLIPEISDKKVRTVLSCLQFIPMFMGMYTDYLYLFVILSVYVKRLMMGEIPLPFSKKVEKPAKEWFLGSLRCGGASILALLLFVLQVVINGPVRVLDMFLFRTGMGNGGDGWAQWFQPKFWEEYMVNGYGTYTEQILKYSLVALLVFGVAYLILISLKNSKFQRSKDFEVTAGTALLFIVPCFLQVNALRNHSAIHDFSTLKFSLVMSVVPFVLLPLAIYYLILFIRKAECTAPAQKRGHKIFTAVLATVMLAGSVALTWTTHNEKAASFFPQANQLYIQEGNLIRHNTDYYDVIFTNDAEYEVSNIRPQSLSQTMKRVYYVSETRHIYDRLYRLEADYRVCILDKEGVSNSQEWNELISKGYLRASSGEMRLYSVSKADFINYIASL